MDRENNQNINRFFMFILSLVPGCAHMYLGLMKRGVQLLLSFCLLIGVATLVNLGFIIGPIMVVLYVYSFFDGYNILRNIQAGKTVEDESIVEGLDSVKKIITNGYWVGAILIGLGAILSIQTVWYSLPIMRIFRQEYYYVFRNIIPAIFLFGIGIYLMSKGNKQRKVKKEEKQKQLHE